MAIRKQGKRCMVFLPPDQTSAIPFRCVSEELSEIRLLGRQDGCSVRHLIMMTWQSGPASRLAPEKKTRETRPLSRQSQKRRAEVS